MTALRTVRAEDQIETDVDLAGKIDAAPLLGEWVNTNPETRGLVRVVIRRDGDDLMVRILGAKGESTFDWGETRASALYAMSVQSSKVMAFTASYDFGFLEARLEANLSLGLLVIASFNTFRDRSGRSNYFSREFFFHARSEIERRA
jgi:hypothetical protein